MRPHLAIAAVIGLAACDQDQETAATSAPAPAESVSTATSKTPVLPPSSAQPARVPAVAEGPVASVEAVAAAEMQEAAAVSQLHLAPEQNAKVFSVSGGDPAVNGLVTYLGLFAGSADGWRVYPVGDYAEWRVEQAAAGRMVIVYRQDTAGPDGDIVARDGRVIVSWTPGPDGAPPAAVGVAQAR